jgi:hypothetical protein
LKGLDKVRAISISRNAVVQVAGVAALLAGARVAHDLAVATAFAYPEYDFGQRGIAFCAVLATLIFTFVLAGVRAFQLRLIEMVALLALLLLPFSFNETIDKDYWRFRIRKPEYQSIIQTDVTPSPKYRVFDWGNRSPPFGAGVTFEAIVFDESDEISRTPEYRSAEWLKGEPSPPWGIRWITAPDAYPGCKRQTKLFGEHFYYVSQEC